MSETAYRWHRRTFGTRPRGPTSNNGDGEGHLSPSPVASPSLREMGREELGGQLATSAAITTCTSLYLAVWSTNAFTPTESSSLQVGGLSLPFGGDGANGVKGRGQGLFIEFSVHGESGPSGDKIVNGSIPQVPHLFTWTGMNLHTKFPSSNKPRPPGFCYSQHRLLNYFLKFILSVKPGCSP